MRLSKLNQDNNTLSSDPTQPYHATTKRYVDAELLKLKEAFETKPPVVLTGNVADLALSAHFVINLTEDRTISFQLPPGGITEPLYVLFEINNDEVPRTIIWDFPNLMWSRGRVVQLTTGGKDYVGFFSSATGDSWTGIAVAPDVRAE